MASGGLKHVASGAVGVVKWFDGASGRITFQKFGDVFVHRSQIKRPASRGGKMFLAKGGTVECDIKRGPKGLQATSVVVVSSDDDESSTCSFESSSEEVAARARTFLEHDIRGEVASFTAGRGFGFIKTQQFGRIFFHVSDLAFPEDKVSPGQFVKCDVARGSRGLMAVGVQRMKEVLVPAGKTHRRSPSATSRAARRRSPSLHRSADREVLFRDVLGEVERYNSDKQSGFIKAHSHGSVPVCRKDVEQRADLQPKQIVKFDIAQGPASAMAINVKVVTEPLRRSPSTPSLHCPCAEVQDDRWTANVSELRRKFESLDAAGQKTRDKGSERKVCGICEDVLEDPVVTPCQHVFCRECLLEWIPFQPRCPVDNKPLSKRDIQAMTDRKQKRFGRHH